MNGKKVTLYAALAALALVAGFVTASAFRRQRPGPFVPFTATFRVEERSDDGELLGTETHVQWRRSDGAWHETRDASDGRSYDTYAEPGRGMFLRRGDQLFRLGDPYTPPGTTFEEWRAFPGYVRDDVVDGIPVVLSETPHEGDAKYWSRYWFAPSLGGLVVRAETHMPGLTRYKTLVTLDRREPQRPVPPIPDMPPGGVKDMRAPGVR